MKIIIVTDAWLPQTNGVVRTLQAMVHELTQAGHKVRVIGPDRRSWSCWPLPFYPEIALEFFPARRLARHLEAYEPEAIHIATEGPLGVAARHWCLRRKKPFTTAYHTRFPEYFGSQLPRPLRLAVERLVYEGLRQFHAPAQAVMVATDTIYDALTARGFKNIVRWARGVDTTLFKPYGKVFGPFEELARPILLYVGRISAEKNLRAFLELHTTGQKVVIGSGPDLKKLKARYNDALFMGRMERETLARAYAAADLFVFPSKTDTFGLVLLEACAAGLRIAAYPVAGPQDVLGGAEGQAFSVLDADLQTAVDQALTLPDTVLLPRAFAEKHSWAVSAAQFYQNLCTKCPS